MGLLDKYKQTTTNGFDVKQLEEAVRQASQKYYTDGTSELSDTQFDEALSELKVLDPSNPLVTEVGHGYNVDRDTTGGQKKPHRYSLVGSLDKVHNWKELSSELKNRRVVYSLKLDGISCVLYYTNGELDCALTRGDGKVGIDVTDKVLTIAPDTKTLRSTLRITRTQRIQETQLPGLLTERTRPNRTFASCL